MRLTVLRLADRLTATWATVSCHSTRPFTSRSWIRWASRPSSRVRPSPSQGGCNDPLPSIVRHARQSPVRYLYWTTTSGTSHPRLSKIPLCLSYPKQSVPRRRPRLRLDMEHRLGDHIHGLPGSREARRGAQWIKIYLRYLLRYLYTTPPS